MKLKGYFTFTKLALAPSPAGGEGSGNFVVQQESVNVLIYAN